MSAKVIEPTAEFPALARPPIVEVVCGFVFESVAALDGLALGVYWDRRKLDFPDGALQAAFADSPEILVGDPLLRAVLVSFDKSRVIQVQHDRLYMNWRAKGSIYPRFSGGTGLLKDAVSELSTLSSFIDERLGHKLRLTRIELVKIDLFDRRKHHWTDLADLEQLLPITATLGSIHYTGNRDFALRFGEYQDSHKLHISINSVAERAGGEVVAVRVESRAIHPLAAGEDVEVAFASANRAVNRAFFALVGKGQLRRFSEPEEVTL